MANNLGLEVIKEIKVEPIWRDWRWRRWAFAALVYIALTAILAVDFLPDRVSGIQVGKPSPKAVKAVRDVEVVDEEATAQRRAEAEKSVGNVYKRNLSAEARSVEGVRRFFSTMIRLKNDRSLSRDEKYDEITREISSFRAFIARQSIDRMLGMSVDQLTKAQDLTVASLQNFYAQQVAGDDIVFRRELLLKNVFAASADPVIAQAVADVGSAYLVSNYELDRAKTNQLKKDAAASVKPVVVRKQKGEEVVGEGKIVSETQVKLLREMGLIGRGIDLTRLAGYSLLSLAMMIAFAIYLHNFQRKIYYNGRLLLVLALIIVGTVAIAKIAISFSALYLVPVMAAGMLTTLLFNVELAIGVIIITSLYSGLMAAQDFKFTLIWLLGGLFAMYSVWHIKQRTDLARAGAWVALVTGALGVATSFISSSPSIDELAKNLSWGLAGGLSASVLTIGLLPFLEKVFGITTDIRLVELSYANQPLLKELMIKAPGTYNHSVMTGNLAESAAEQVGANPLLARVGAYYHDIGKIKRPLFFVENQIGGENPHDHTNPNLSCLIITNHVKEGIELAEKHGLPKEIVDIIREHHGTSVLSYFYHRAKENLIKEQVCESDFRYSGSKPRSREAALVMLADSIEAAARTIAKPTPNRLEQLIKRVVQQKLDDGQLSESDLTLKDLDRIVRSFTQVLISIYHTRIEYPLSAVPTRSANGGSLK